MISEQLGLVLCEEKDLTALVSMSKKTYKQHYAYLWEDQGLSYIKEQFNRDIIREQLLLDDCQFYFITLNNSNIGVIKLNYGSDLAEYPGNSCMEIQRIYLLHQYTRKGHGAKVFYYIEQLALQKEKDVLWLMVMDSSPVRTFYKNQGYVLHSKTTYEHPRILQHLKGMHVMVKQLN